MASPSPLASRHSVHSRNDASHTTHRLWCTQKAWVAARGRRRGRATAFTPTGISPTVISPTGIVPTGVPPTGITPIDISPIDISSTGESPTGSSSTAISPTGITPTGIISTGIAPTGIAPTVATAPDACGGPSSSSKGHRPARRARFWHSPGVGLTPTSITSTGSTPGTPCVNPNLVPAVPAAVSRWGLTPPRCPGVGRCLSSSSKGHRPAWRARSSHSQQSNSGVPPGQMTAHGTATTMPQSRQGRPPRGWSPACMPPRRLLLEVPCAPKGKWRE